MKTLIYGESSTGRTLAALSLATEYEGNVVYFSSGIWDIQTMLNAGVENIQEVGNPEGVFQYYYIGGLPLPDLDNWDNDTLFVFDQTPIDELQVLPDNYIVVAFTPVNIPVERTLEFSWYSPELHLYTEGDGEWYKLPNTLQIEQVECSFQGLDQSEPRSILLADVSSHD